MIFYLDTRGSKPKAQEVFLSASQVLSNWYSRKIISWRENKVIVAYIQRGRFRGNESKQPSRIQMLRSERIGYVVLRSYTKEVLWDRNKRNGSYMMALPQRSVRFLANQRISYAVRIPASVVTVRTWEWPTPVFLYPKVLLRSSKPHRFPVARQLERTGGGVGEGRRDTNNTSSLCLKKLVTVDLRLLSANKKSRITNPSTYVRWWYNLIASEYLIVLSRWGRLHLQKNRRYLANNMETTFRKDDV